MLREPQHERKILNDIKARPFVPSSSSGRTLSTVEGLRQSFSSKPLDMGAEPAENCLGVATRRRALLRISTARG